MESRMSLLTVVCVAMLVCGCATATRHHNSSVVQYLYPDSVDHVETTAIPRLALPLKVGVAFVPEELAGNQDLTERDKMELMKEVGRHFQKYEFVKSLELIPSAYLRARGGFTNLDQIRTMYGVDIIALLSYDQTQFTDEGLASISYWTLVGAYIVRGEKNDTHTMVDAAVYDIQSRKMLFRAPGVSHIKSKATLVNLSEQLRADSARGFKEASQDLVANLDLQLGPLMEEIKASPAEYEVIYRAGYSGGGSLDGCYIIFFSILGGNCLWRKWKRHA